MSMLDFLPAPAPGLAPVPELPSCARERLEAGFCKINQLNESLYIVFDSNNRYLVAPNLRKETMSQILIWSSNRTSYVLFR